VWGEIERDRADIGLRDCPVYPMWPSYRNFCIGLRGDRVIPIAKPLISDEEKQAVLGVLNSGILAQGPRVQAFEESFAYLRKDR